MFRSTASLLRRFAANQSGATAIMFALSALPVLLSIGAAVDYMRYTNAQTRLQAALDSGALAVAAAGNLSDTARIDAGKSAFNINVANEGFDFETVEASFQLVSGRVEASAKLALPTGFMQIAGIDKMDIDVSTEIRVPEGKKAEVALVLDYSGSMDERSGGQVKYVAMKNAATKLINDLEAASPDKVKIGLVPFSHHVRVTLPKSFVVGQSGSGNWTGCTQDRRYPYNLTDATPVTSNNATKWGHPQAPMHLSEGCGPYEPKGLTVVPLTKDFSLLRNRLAAMRPYMWTHIALGAEFGYQLLSPNAPFTEGADYGDKGVQKVMVLLTDGRQTEPAYGSSGRTVSNGEENLSAICENAKDSGIMMITVAFDLRDQDTRDLLRGCATDASKHFFIAEDSTELASAFEDIRRQITAQVFISR